MDSLATWMLEMLKDANFRAFMKIIGEKKETCMKKALIEGNTDYIKGKFYSLDWVSNLPEVIIKQSKNDSPDT